MPALKYISVTLEVGAADTGFWAEYSWFMASKTRIDLGYHPPGLLGGTVRLLGSEFPRFPKLIDPDASQANEIIAAWEAIHESSRLGPVDKSSSRGIPKPVKS